MYTYVVLEQVAEYKLIHGQCANPFITGSSVHKQRIERLWRDVFHCVISVYYQVFDYLESSNKLNPLSEVDIYCLHAAYNSMINNALEAFGWNNHVLTTEHAATPLQLFAAGILTQRSSLSTPPTYSFNDVSTA